MRLTTFPSCKVHASGSKIFSADSHFPFSGVLCSASLLPVSVLRIWSFCSDHQISQFLLGHLNLIFLLLNFETKHFEFWKQAEFSVATPSGPSFVLKLLQRDDLSWGQFKIPHSLKRYPFRRTSHLPRVERIVSCFALWVGQLKLKVVILPFRKNLNLPKISLIEELHL